MSDKKNDQKIVMAHGGGGELTRRLLQEKIIPKLSNDLLNPLTDSAVLPKQDGKLCFTTDAFVVQPLEFPGGDIGNLAVCGTVNDLAVMGAEPKALSLAIVIEEGLDFETFDKMINSIAKSAADAGVVIATGDTKVVERGRGDGMVITTAGIGVMQDSLNMDSKRIQAGDVIIINGQIADHGLAVMSARENLSFDTEVLSDVAPLNGLVKSLIQSGADIKFLRDPTRGGLAGVLADLSEETKFSVEVDENAIPISTAAYHTAEMLGLDPLTVANEGKCVAVVPVEDADKAIEAMKSHALGQKAAVIGEFTSSEPAMVELITKIGGRRVVSRPYGEDLPRIC